MTSWPLLSLLVFVPLAGAGALLLIRGEAAEVARNARWTALWVSVMTLMLSLWMWWNFNSSSADFQMVESASWIDVLGIKYTLGVDGISLFFVLLSAFLTPLCILVSWESITTRVRDYMVGFLVLESMMIGVFCALDVVVFYIFFEAVLIPMFVIIGVWGGQRRTYAAFKFFLYTLLGSILLLLAVIVMSWESGTTDMRMLLDFEFDEGLQRWLWLAFFASFAVKVPMWPVHTWLPDAHVEAPTAGSVILAGVLLKMGGYGFLRFSLPMFPEASAYFTPMVWVLSGVALVYTSLVALVQDDMKKLIAYSSVAHMGFVTAAIFSPNQQAIAGSIIQMLSHGLVSGALFVCVGVLYDRMHTREIARYGGLVQRMPRYAALLMLFSLASVGLPGTSGFVGEFLILVGTYQESSWLAAVLALGMVLGAGYMLHLYRRVIFGALVREDLKEIMDLKRRELLILVPLALVVLWMGIYPESFLGPIRASVGHLVADYNFALTNSSAHGLTW